MPQGNYSAYSQQYGRGPVDVAGKVGAQVTQSIKDKQVRDDKLAAEKKADDLRLEKEARDKTQRNAELYDEKTAKIIDTQDAPPSAQEVSITAGDEIYRLQKSGLEGIDLMRAIDKVTKDANSAIKGITSAADAKANAPQDAFYQDGAFGSSNDQMMNGDFAFTYKDGRGQFVGDGNEYSVGEYNGMRGKTLDIPQINAQDSVTALDGLRKSQEWNLNKTEGRNAYIKASNDQANGLISTGNATAATRWMYNNADSIGLAGGDKEMLLEAGRTLADGAKYEDLSPEQRAIFDKYSPQARELYSNNLTKNLPKIAPETTGTGGGTGTGTGGSKEINYTDPRAYVQSVNERLDTAPDIEGISTSVEEGELTQLEEALGVTAEINLEGTKLGRFVGTSSQDEGTIELTDADGNVQEIPFGGDNPSKKDAVAAYLKNNTKDFDIIERFESVENLVGEASNYKQISTDLDIKFRDKGLDFRPTKEGIVIEINGKNTPIKLAGKTPEERAIAINIIVETIK